MSIYNAPGDTRFAAHVQHAAIDISTRREAFAFDVIAGLDLASRDFTLASDVDQLLGFGTCAGATAGSATASRTAAQ